MKMDRISWNVIQRRLLVIARPHLGFCVCCHLLTQPASGRPKCDGLYVPLIPLQREITRDAEYEPDSHGHFLQMSKVKVSVTLASCLSLPQLN